MKHHDNPLSRKGNYAPTHAGKASDREGHVMNEEEFRWAYAISRTDMKDAPPIQYFERLAYAKEALKGLQEMYPDVPFGIFARGDQLFQGAPEIHEMLH